MLLINWVEQILPPGGGSGNGGGGGANFGDGGGVAIRAGGVTKILTQ